VTDPSAPPCVLVVADRERVGELVAALSDLPGVEVVVSSGGDDTIDLFAARRPAVVVLTASLQHGDAGSLIAALRARVPRAEVAIVVIGDDAGQIRTALDALDLAPDRFVTRPLSSRALRFAVTGGIEAVRLVRSSPPSPLPVRIDTQPGGTPPPRLPRPPSVHSGAPPPRVPPVPAAAPSGAEGHAPESTTRAALRARWEALADSMAELPGDADTDEPAPPPPPLVIKPRRRHIEVVELAEEADAVVDAIPVAWKPERIDDIAPPREPTLILREPAPVQDPPEPSRTRTGDGAVVVAARTSSQELWSEPMSIPALADREPGEPGADGEDGDHGPDGNDDGHGDDSGDGGEIGRVRSPDASELDDGFDVDELVEQAAIRPGGGAAGGPPEPRAGHDTRDTHDEIRAPAQARAETRSGDVTGRRRSIPHDVTDIAGPPGDRGSDPGASGPEPRDFARELRAKMSMMAQRLFHRGDAPAPSPVDHAPRHDHHTEIDLAGLGDEPSLAGMTDLEARGAPRLETRELATSPGSPGSAGSAGSAGSWDTQVRERGLPDGGAIVRGVSDAAMLLAKMFAQGATGRIGFRRDEVETIVYFDHGRPVFASSNEPRDRMGELLLREGKITASQYERCQAVVAESGRRMGEILVDFGYLKRRELLPAVRRHVEDLVYSLFGWERGAYAITHDAEPSAERIRLSRHPAALILEGIRRKLDRSSLERLIGPPSTVIEVRDRDRLGGIIQMGDLAAEERAALAAFDGQADLAQVARTTGVDVADVLPLAWGLCVLGLATARRSDAEVSEEVTALIGETDLAIDRERVRARWQLVTEADYFALLGVRRDATGFEIRRAYQSARRDFSADGFPSNLRRELARELDDIAHVLDEAFRVLRDDRLRQTYLANLVDH
jgi:CheY-like chemotaxis protein